MRKTIIAAKKTKVIAAKIGDILKDKGQKIPGQRREYVPEKEPRKPHVKTKIDRGQTVEWDEQVLSDAEKYQILRDEFKQFFGSHFKPHSPDWRFGLNSVKHAAYIFNDDLQDSWQTAREAGKPVQWQLSLHAKLRITAVLQQQNNISIIAAFTATDGQKRVLEDKLESGIIRIQDMNQVNLERFYQQLYKFVSTRLVRANDVLKFEGKK